MTATSRSRRLERARPLEFDPHPGRDLVKPDQTVVKMESGVRARTVLDGALPHKTVRELYQVQEGCCFHCRKAMLHTATRRRENGRYDSGWTREHMIPKVSGGKNGRNIVLSCRGCNAQKGNRMPTARELEIANGLHDGVLLRRFPREVRECR